MIGVRCSAQTRTICTTSSVDCAKTTASGGCGGWYDSSCPWRSSSAGTVLRRSPNCALSVAIVSSTARRGCMLDFCVSLLERPDVGKTGKLVQLLHVEALIVGANQAAVFEQITIR